MSLSLRKQPLLRRLVIIQSLFIVCLLSIGFFAFHWISSIYVDTKTSQLLEEMRTKLALEEEELRTWDHLDLHQAKERQLKTLLYSYPLLSIEVVPRSSLPTEIPPNAVILPETPDSLNSVVYALVDTAFIKSEYGVNRLTTQIFVALLVLLLLIVLYTVRYIRRYIYEPINGLNQSLTRTHVGEALEVDKINAFGEMKTFVHFIKKMYESSQKAERDSAIAEVSRQVAHDIRSPLTALSMIENNCQELSEDKRVLLKKAIERVRSIADSLTPAKNNDCVRSTERLPYPIIFILENLISEKKVQYADRPIELRLSYDETALKLCAEVQINEFKRVLSNLINNAYEAIITQGLIDVELRSAQTEDSLIVTISDNGCGIPPNILEKITQNGFSFGKPNGSGLGLYHAKTTLEKWGGSLQIRSSPGVGTKVSLTLKRVNPPGVFAEKLEIPKHSTVVVLDDDPSIHELWETRFVKSGLSKQNSLNLKHFSDSESFGSWVKGQDITSSYFLMDYELSGEAVTGLDIIEKYGLQNQTVLVTSYFDLEGLMQRCTVAGVKMLPKSAATYFPVTPASQ